MVRVRLGQHPRPLGRVPAFLHGVPPPRPRIPAPARSTVAPGTSLERQEQRTASSSGSPVSTPARSATPLTVVPRQAVPNPRPSLASRSPVPRPHEAQTSGVEPGREAAGPIPRVCLKRPDPPAQALRAREKDLKVAPTTVAPGLILYRNRCRVRRSGPGVPRFDATRNRSETDRWSRLLPTDGSRVAGQPLPRVDILPPQTSRVKDPQRSRVPHTLLTRPMFHVEHSPPTLRSTEVIARSSVGDLRFVAWC